MEYLEGRTLKELLVTRGPTPIAVAIDYARQILAALGFAHRNGIVHRDIKPHNVLVAPDGRLKVTDFGIARVGHEPDDRDGVDHRHGAVPLARAGARARPSTPASDIYSVGIVLYEMLTGVGAVHGRHAARDRDEAPLGDAGAAVGEARRTSRASSTRSCCARSRRTRTTATSRPRRWTPTSRAPRAARRSRRRRRRRRRRCSRGAGPRRSRPRRPRSSRRPVTVAPPAAAAYGAADRLLRVRRADAPALVLALAARARCSSPRRSSRRLVRLHEDPGPARTRRSRSRCRSSRAAPRRLAVEKLADRGLTASVVRAADDTVEVSARRLDQNPAAGRAHRQGQPRRRSWSRPASRRSTVPGVVGHSARPTPGAALADARPEGRSCTRSTPSEETGTVTGAVSRRPGTRLVKGDKVRINVSQGPKPVGGAAGRRRRPTSRRRRRSRAPASRSRDATSSRTTRQGDRRADGPAGQLAEPRRARP